MVERTGLLRLVHFLVPGIIPPGEVTRPTPGRCWYPIKSEKTMRAIVGAVVLGAVVAAGPLGAQARGYVQLGGGVSIATGVFKEDGGKSGWLAQVAAGLTAPSGVIGGRISGSFARHGSQSGLVVAKLLGAMADVVVAPRMSGKAGIYALAGLGFQNSSYTPGFKETKFAWNAGAGFTVRAGSVGIFVEGRFLSINTTNQKTNTIPITAGVRIGGR
jgi:hypothetical protein